MLPCRKHDGEMGMPDDISHRIPPQCVIQTDPYFLVSMKREVNDLPFRSVLTPNADRIHFPAAQNPALKQGMERTSYGPPSYVYLGIRLPDKVICELILSELGPVPEEGLVLGESVTGLVDIEKCVQAVGLAPEGE